MVIRDALRDLAIFTKLKKQVFRVLNCTSGIKSRKTSRIIVSHDFNCTQLFHDGGRYHIETSPLICYANQWTGFSMITASVMKELMKREIYNFLFDKFNVYLLQTRPLIPRKDK